MKQIRRMDAWTIWLIVMGLLLIIELLSQMMWALCLAVGCLGGLVGSLFGISVPWQVLISALLSICLLYTSRCV